MNTKKSIAIATALTIAIFIVSVSTPLGYTDWLLYILPILIAAPAVGRPYIFLFPLADTVLIAMDFLLSPPGGIPVIAVINRATGIITLWIVSFLIARRQQAEEALARSYQELEQRIEDRTAELKRLNRSLTTEIAERKRAEENLKRSMEEVERSNQELEQFAYAVSHDLQEPLRTVGSFVGLLAKRYEGKLDDRADQYISFAIEGANRMSTLIDDLLLYSRVGSRGKGFAEVEMARVFENAVENLKRTIEENSALLTRDDLPMVFGDEAQLTRLLQNLVGNAVKFKKKDVQPRIHVSAERKGAEWVFGVHDNGIGIEPGFQERVFAIFQRLHTREEYPGTGVGLAICRRIVERHKGRIWFESKPGEGSTFYFTVPGKE